MDKRDERFIRTLEELQSSISDQFSEILNGLDQENEYNKNFKKLSEGMPVSNDLGQIGIVQKIDSPHFVIVKYDKIRRIHCMNEACFHYDPIRPIEG